MYTSVDAIAGRFHRIFLFLGSPSTPHKMSVECLRMAEGEQMQPRFASPTAWSALSPSSSGAMHESKATRFSPVATPHNARYSTNPSSILLSTSQEPAAGGRKGGPRLLQIFSPRHAPAPLQLKTYKIWSFAVLPFAVSQSTSSPFSLPSFVALPPVLTSAPHPT